MTELDLSIIIVNWNSKDYLRKCLETVFAQTGQIDFEVIVIDGGSFDGCGQLLAEHFPQVRFIQSERNVGFGQANNLGARRARGEVLLFLNPDTEVKNQAINRLYDCWWNLKKPGVVGCRLLNSDGSLQRSCVQPLPTIFNQVLDADVLQRLFPNVGLWGAKALESGVTGPMEVEVVSGACLMIQKSVFDEIGGFSPEYFMYAEDLDLCFKTRKAALTNYYYGDAVVVHHGGGSTNRSVSNFSNVMMRESVYRIIRKMRGPTYSNWYRVALSGSAVFRFILLMVISPAWFAAGKKASWDRATHKWLGILRWGLGLEGWVLKYGQIQKVTSMQNRAKANSCVESSEN